MRYLARVAVIARTKNRSILLERALNSVLDQTFHDWFLVVVNDGGEKGDVDRLIAKYEERFSGRVAVIHNDVSLGMEAASNCGIAYGDSEYIVIHDDDDSWAPNFLLMCVNELEQAAKMLPSIQGVICYSLRVLERIERGSIVVEQIEPYNKWIPRGVLNFFRMVESNMFPPISFLYRRAALDAVGGYREDLPVLGDWEFNLRFMSHFDIYVVSHALAFYHHRVAASGHLGNSVIAGSTTHELYNQYLRNELLRHDVQGKAHGLGVVVNLALRFSMMQDHVNTTASQVATSAVTPDLAGGERAGWTPIWVIASVFTFLKNGARGTLIRKFVKHWREEGPRRALAVVTRFGYLAMGGK